MWLSYVRVCGALSVTLLSGVYYFVQLRGVCELSALQECISRGPTDRKVDKKSTFTVDGPGKKTATLVRPALWPQTRATEELLIWSGHLDGEVDRIEPTAFEKAVKDVQSTLGPGITSGEQQRAVLEKRIAGIRGGYRFEKENNPQAGELWLPHRLLPSGRQLSYGTQYQSITGDFVVDVAERDAAVLTIETVRKTHCCKPGREPEGRILDISDAGGPGFLLNARDGKQRVSVRAQQRDGVIRILAIAYDVDKDKEYRVLRNAIASSYLAFAVARKREDRVSSCARGDGERCADKPAPAPTGWDNQNGPL